MVRMSQSVNEDLGGETASAFNVTTKQSSFNCLPRGPRGLGQFSAVQFSAAVQTNQTASSDGGIKKLQVSQGDTESRILV